MKSFQAKLFFLFFAALFLPSACGRGENANRNADSASQAANTVPDANLTRDDAEEFGKIVNLPFTPEEIAWREIDAKNQKRLIAVFKLSSADAQSIVAQAEKHKPAALGEVDAEDWFPPELVAQSQQSGDTTLKGNAYAANDFMLEPYKNGKLTRVKDTNYFVLELTSQ
jgi:hypothetical protein